MRRLQLITPLLLSLACDAATAEAEVKTDEAVQAPAVVAVAADGGAAVVVDADAALAADAKVEIKADAFKLARVTALVQGGEIETAEELELAVNDPEADINSLDIDADGTVDHVEVVEVRGDARVDFQLKVIPSSRATVTHAVELATASVVAARATSEVSFSASFSAGVSFTGGASASASALSFVAPATFEASAVIVAQPLLAWVFVAERPLYTSVYIEEKSGRWIPPGHLKHGHWKATGAFPGGVAVDSHGRGKGKFKVDVDVGADAHARAGAGAKAHGHADKHDGPSHSNSKPHKSSAPKPEPKSSPKGNDKGGGASKASSDKGGGGKGGGGKGGGGGGGGKGKNK